MKEQEPHDTAFTSAVAENRKAQNTLWQKTGHERRRSLNNGCNDNANNSSFDFTATEFVTILFFGKANSTSPAVKHKTRGFPHLLGGGGGIVFPSAAVAG